MSECLKYTLFIERNIENIDIFYLRTRDNLSLHEVNRFSINIRLKILLSDTRGVVSQEEPINYLTKRSCYRSLLMVRETSNVSNLYSSLKETRLMCGFMHTELNSSHTVKIVLCSA